MLNFNAIPMDFDSYRKILSRLSAYSDKLNDAFLTDEFDLAFLCGAIKNFRPKKILEVGVAAGGSTATILQALEDLGERYEMHSVDVVTKHWYYTNADIGFLATFAKENVFGTLNGTHELHLGKILPQVIDEIGDGVDFVFLDTKHLLPGEVLDFLTVLPYLTDDAVVVLHDVTLHQLQTPKDIATGVLFSAVTANKFLNFRSDDDELFRYPNIGAFQVNEHTAAYVENVFLSLILPWDYAYEDQVVCYREHFRRFYDDALLEIFQEAVDMNAYNLWLESQNQTDTE